MTISSILKTVQLGRQNRDIQFKANKIFRKILKSSYFSHLRKVWFFKTIIWSNENLVFFPLSEKSSLISNTLEDDLAARQNLTGDMAEKRKIQMLRSLLINDEKMSVRTDD